MYNFFYTLLFALSFVSVAHSQVTRYVKQNATGSGDGSSWENASSDLRKMINASLDGDFIFVAKGTYRPNTASYMYPTSRENSFFIYTNVKMYGGFPENGGTWEERNWEDNPTVLSGDLMEDDWLGNYEDNSYHVMSFQGIHIHENCIVDGFTITGGNASHAERKDYQLGGGLYTAAEASPVFRNMLITGNRADIGGGWYNWTGNPTIENTVIRGNTARMGGGVGIQEGKPKVNNVQIWDNHAKENGGGIYIGNTNEFIWLLKVSIRGNTADQGGGIYKFDGNNGLVNSEITGNVSRRGAAIYNVVGYTRIANCTIAGNASESEIILNSNGYVYIENSAIWGNSSTIVLNPIDTFGYAYSQIESVTVSGGWNISGGRDPLFINPVKAEYNSDPSYRKPTVSGDFRLLTCSPLVDKGDATQLIPEWAITDLGGSQRIVRENVDIGAYEYQGEAGNVVYVDSAAAPGGDGKSWATALKSLALAVEMSNSCSLIEKILVAKGTYYPEYEIEEDRSDGRDRSFFFSRSRATVLGGYPTGGGNTRNWTENQTILSGDVDRNGILDNGNSLHVVLCAAADPNHKVTLDGVIITGGNANEDGIGRFPVVAIMTFFEAEKGYGGGVYNYNGSPTFKNVVIRGNAAVRGGGWYNKSGAARIYNSVISGNRAEQFGGGAYVKYSSIEGYNMTVSGNRAGTSGGGFYSLDYNQKFVNCIIRDNQSDAGALDHFGGGGERFFRTIIGQYRYNTGEALNLGSAGILDPVTLRLLPGSPAIDAGIEYDGSSGFHLDLAGNKRLVGTALDLGAYEVQDGSLPVTLAAFNATLYENAVLLKWKTTEEVNASHFEVERSRDARNWETIGIVKAGNGTYTYSDLPTVFRTNGNPVLIYYRLRMVDYDRTFELSPIEAVALKNMQDNRAVRIYPNPAIDGRVTVETRGGTTPSDLRILDLTGREVKALQTTEQKVSLDVSDLSKGLYLIYIKSGEDLVVEKMVVQ